MCRARPIAPRGRAGLRDESLKTYRERYTAVGAVHAQHTVQLGFEIPAPLRFRILYWAEVCALLPLVVVKQGERGAFAVRGDETWELRPDCVRRNRG